MLTIHEWSATIKSSIYILADARQINNKVTEHLVEFRQAKWISVQAHMYKRTLYLLSMVLISKILTWFYNVYSLFLNC